MFDYISAFGQQLRTGYNLGKSAALPDCRFTSAIFCGMGGSAIGGDLLAAYARPSMKIPLFINRHNTLPGWVNENTLVIISSYSGNTEETLACFDQALQRKSRILALTSGGKLAELCAEHRHCCIKIPGGLPPRAALGYSFAPLYAVFEQYRFIKSGEKTLMQAAEAVEKLTEDFCRPNGRPARLANKLHNKIPVFYAPAQYFEPVVTRFRCQLAENAKTLAFANTYPELAHNEIVGWGRPYLVEFQLAAVFLQNPAKIDTFLTLADNIKSILKSEKIPVYNINLSGAGLLQKMLGFVHFADWLSYHLAVLKKIDPLPIARIDLLKQKMSADRQPPATDH